MIRSALDTSDADILLYVDSDDPRCGEVGRFSSSRVHVTIGDPIGRGQAVNYLCDQRRGYDAYLMVSDDITFVRNGWDVDVEQAFARWPDKIGLVHLASENGESYANWCVLHRKWLDATGWFNWPECRWFCQDTILQTLAQALDRVAFIEPKVIQHLCIAAPDVEQRLDFDCRRMLWFYAKSYGETLDKLRRAIACAGSESSCAATSGGG